MQILTAVLPITQKAPAFGRGQLSRIAGTLRRNVNQMNAQCQNKMFLGDVKVKPNVRNSWNGIIVHAAIIVNRLAFRSGIPLPQITDSTHEHRAAQMIAGSNHNWKQK
jgi:hypothetical protein